MNSHIKQTLKINSFEVWISLGCSQEEQSMPQPIKIDLTVIFDKPLKGSATDQLADAIDYVFLLKETEKVVLSRPFQLIENVCFMVHQHLITQLKQAHVSGELKTEATKLRPPVSQLQGGISFTCQSAI